MTEGARARLLGSLALGAAIVAAAWVSRSAPTGRAVDAMPSRTWYVAPGAAGNGSETRPFPTIADALAAAQAGDTVRVRPGTYRESVRTVRGGRPDAPLTLRADDPAARPLLQSAGRVLTVNHPHVIVEGLRLDGAYGPDDAVRVSGEGSHLVLRHVEIAHAGRDCLDMGNTADVLIERALVHHCLDATGGRRDAHGVVAGAAERLTIRDSEVHTFSGDAIQLDPSRASPGWTDVRLERLRLWLAPLPEAANGFAAGVVPGENAIDTKTPRDGRRARLTVEDVEAFGFQDGLIANMAAFNIKERVDATFTRVRVHHASIAFRVRGSGDRGARVHVQDAVVHHVGTGFRYEDDIDRLTVRAVTFGRSVAEAFRRVNAPATQPDVRDITVLGTALPAEARGQGRAVGPEAFVNAEADDYRRATAVPRP